MDKIAELVSGQPDSLNTSVPGPTVPAAVSRDDSKKLEELRAKACIKKVIY